MTEKMTIVGITKEDEKTHEKRIEAFKKQIQTRKQQSFITGVYVDKGLSNLHIPRRDDMMPSEEELRKQMIQPVGQFARNTLSDE